MSPTVNFNPLAIEREREREREGNISTNIYFSRWICWLFEKFYLVWQSGHYAIPLISIGKKIYVLVDWKR